MNTYEELRKWFSSGQKTGFWELETMPPEYPAYGVKKDYYGFGVAIFLPNKSIVINETFSNCYFHSELKNVKGEETNILYLLCKDFEYYIEFASICAQLVEPGENGVDRKKLLENPLDWWNNWKNLIGNSILTKQVYSIIAELLVLEHLYENDKTVIWTGAKAGTNDIENSNEGFEVKSTIKREGYTFTASSEFQLLTSKSNKLKLFFCRMEKSPRGDSINNLVNRLSEKGYSKKDLNDDLIVLGLPFGNSARDEKYKIIEKRIYEVTEDFPRITPDSFKDGVIPKGITHIVYNVDLGAIENYTSW